MPILRISLHWHPCCSNGPGTSNRHRRSISGLDVKGIAESVLAALDLDYAIFDVTQSDPRTWKVTFFDVGRTLGRSIIDILVDSTYTSSSEDAVKEEVKQQLTSRLGRAISHPL